MSSVVNPGDVEHWYTFDGVYVHDIADLCQTLNARICGGKLLVFFRDAGERDDFERRCSTHPHAAVRKITRVVEVQA